jgi:hypothetical protein
MRRRRDIAKRSCSKVIHGARNIRVTKGFNQGQDNSGGVARQQ